LGLWRAQMKGQYVADSGPVALKKLAAKACRSLHGYARIFPIAKPRAWLWQGSYNWLAKKPGDAHRAWQKSLDNVELLEMPYDRGLAHFKIGQHLSVTDTNRNEHLQHAVRIFAQLGATWDLALVHQALANGRAKS
jgi:hypothetical protein